MSIASAVKGTVVKAADLDPTIQNDLVNQGIAAPRDGGQSFEFLQGWADSSQQGSYNPYPTDYFKSQVNQAGFASNTLESELRAASDANKAAIKQQFAQQAERVGMAGAATQGASNVQGRITAGTGSGLGADTTLGNIRALEMEAVNRSLKDLKAAEAQAIATNDMNLLSNIRQAKNDEFTRSMELRSAERADRGLMLQELSTKAGISQAEKGLQLEEKRINVNEEQFNKTFGLNEQQAADQRSQFKQTLDQNTKQFGITTALDMVGKMIDQGNTLFNQQIALQELANSTPAGTKISIGGNQLTPESMKIMYNTIMTAAETGLIDPNVALSSGQLNLLGSYTVAGRKAPTGTKAEGVKVKTVTPLYDQTSNQYVADEVLFSDGSKEIRDASGAPMSPDINLGNTRRGNPLSTDVGNVAEWEKQGEVWSWLATEQAQAMDDEAKAQAIQSFGFDPFTFGY